MKQTLVVRQVAPIAFLAYYMAILSRVEQYYLTRQVFYELHVYPVLPRERHAFQYAVRCHPAQGSKAYLQQPLATDMHEIAAYIHLEDITRLRIIAALLPYMLLQAHDTVVRTATGNTTIGILDKRALEQFVRVVVIEVMHHPVAESGSEHLAFLRVGNNKAGAGTRLVRSFPQLVTQHLQVLIQTLLELLYIRFHCFMPFSVLKRGVQVYEQLRTGKREHKGKC
mgnify:CR=1 FL=1